MSDCVIYLFTLPSARLKCYCVLCFIFIYQTCYFYHTSCSCQVAYLIIGQGVLVKGATARSQNLKNQFSTDQLVTKVTEM